MTYVDGFVIPMPKNNVEDYKVLAGKAGAVWMEYGALGYKECVMEDKAGDMCPNFPALVKAEEDETVVFAFILYKSRAHRDEVNAKVMADPRMQEMCPTQSGNPPPFDMTRMAFSGFEAVVDL